MLRAACLKSALVAAAGECETPYLEEWVNYHLSIGFDEIYLYLNNWSFLPVAADKRIHFIKWDGEAVQCKAYNDFLTDRSQPFNWALFIDCDEFLDLNKKFKDVKEMFQSYDTFVGVAFNWVLYGDSGLTNTKSGFSVAKRFTKCDKNINQHVKVAVNLDMMRTSLKTSHKFVCPHCTNVGSSSPSFIAADKSTFVIGPWNKVDIRTEEYEWPTLNHYFCKTREEWTERRKYGRADTPKSSSFFYRNPEEFDQHNKNDIERPLFR